MRGAVADAVDPCIAINGGGVQYREFSCMYPSLDPFYFNFEKYYDPAATHRWMQKHSHVPILACILYGIGIVLGRRFFASRPRWNWRYTLAAWNLSLSLFSVIGMLRTGPQLLHNLLHMSIRDNLCGDPRGTYGSGSSGLWIQLFILSKFPELMDTFFIVIHKKPLIFLHWYHHITVLLYCWHSYVTTSPPGIFFVVMNYSVHAIMYFYYFLMAIRMKPAWLHPMVITVSQISQMFVGVAVTTTAAFYSYQSSRANRANATATTESVCHVSAENNAAAFLMYGSYLFLFLQFFLCRYVGQKKKQQQHQQHLPNHDPLLHGSQKQKNV